MFRSAKKSLHPDKKDYDEDEVQDAPVPPRKTNVNLDDDDNGEEHKKRSAPSASGGPAKRSKMSAFLGDEEAHDDEDDDDEPNGPHRDPHGVVRRELVDDEAQELIHQQDRHRCQQSRFSVDEEDARSVAVMPSVQDRVEDNDGSMHASHTALSQQSLAPSLSDPRLWMVNCMTGKEEELVYQIMNKSIDLACEGRQLGITGVFASQTKGKIYLEAHSEAAVVDAIQGIQGIMQYSKRLVPIGDMITVMTVKPVKVPVKENEWVRLQRWPYKGDLALVKFVHKSRQKVVVQFVPRLDLTESDLPREEARDRRRKIRPPQKLFNSQEVAAMGMQTTRQRFLGLDIVCDVFEGNYYHEGYQLKEMTVGTMVKKITDETSPTIHELQSFRNASKYVGEDDDGEEYEGSKLPESLLDERSELQGKTREKNGVTRGGIGGGVGGLVIGETVEVIEGELIGLRGKLISLDGSKVKVQPITNHIEQPKELEFLASQVRKYVDVSTRYQLMEIQSGLLSLRQETLEIKTVINEMKVNLERSFAVLNGNIRRIASQSVRRRIGESELGVAEGPGGAVDNPAMATLMPTPRSLHELWQEYQYGVGGRKAARLFSHAERGRSKHRYCRRKIVWDLVAGLVRQGHSADHAIEKIYAIYGGQTSVTSIINGLKRDKRDGTLNPVLRI